MSLQDIGTEIFVLACMLFLAAIAAAIIAWLLSIATLIVYSLFDKYGEDSLIYKSFVWICEDGVFYLFKASFVVGIIGGILCLISMFF